MSENSTVAEFLDLVKKGREGKNQGLPIGLTKLEDYIGELLGNETILVAADSGVGKSTFVLYSYVYRPIMSDECEKKDYRIAMYNYEMTESQILAKLLGMYLYEKYGEILTFTDIFSRGKVEGEANILSDEYYDLIEECIPILEKFANRITFFPEAKTSELYEEKLLGWLENFGTFENPFNGFVDNTYTPNNPDQILGVITDHLNMVSAIPNIKVTIDNIANMQVSARNMCKILTFIDIMQLNRGASGDARIRSNLREPQSSDFRDSSVVYDGSHIVMTLFSPFKAEIKEHSHYQVERLGNRYISVKILKNRFGVANIRDALAFYGEISSYRELPKASEIVDYEKYANPDWLIASDEPVSEPKKLSNFKL